jgi:NAD(P)-dependent dehydrogenase (short-subunit alcohol dehydrogenase family)
MNDCRFDGRVAIVTGAGGNPGLGRAYARALASRGAKVVINDLGVGPDGHEAIVPKAEAVAQEIVDEGGEAVANSSSVAEKASAEEVVQAAVDEWGRIDILVNNAGVMNVARFDEISEQDISLVISSQVMGNIWMCRAAWPYMKEAEYGRIVGVTSDAMLGMYFNVVYGAAKGAIFSLMRGLAIEGAEHGIQANAIGPTAGTKASKHFIQTSEWLEKVLGENPPELVAPVVAFLAHEDCPWSGKYIECAGGWVAERFFAETGGIVEKDLTPEFIRDHVDEITNRQTAQPIDDPKDKGKDLVPKPYEPDSK